MLRSEPRGGKRAFALDLDGFRIGGKLATAEVPPPEGRPIILAIHGGTYSCDYFDVPGYSLLDRARARGFDVLALDRPGYRGSTPLPEAPDMIATNAECLARTLPGILHRFDAADAPVFIVAHSIGAAIAITMAAAQPEWLRACDLRRRRDDAARERRGLCASAADLPGRDAARDEGRGDVRTAGE